LLGEIVTLLLQATELVPEHVTLVSESLIDRAWRADELRRLWDLDDCGTLGSGRRLHHMTSSSGRQSCGEICSKYVGHAPPCFSFLLLTSARANRRCPRTASHRSVRPPST